MIKVAFPTDDGTTIGRHLGQAKTYVVATLEDGAAPRFETRPKQYHGAHHHDHDPKDSSPAPQPVSMDAIQFTPHAQAPADRTEPENAQHDHGQHSGMFVPLTDCQVLIAGGMGQPAYDHAVGLGLQVILTGAHTIAEALAAYRSGTLQSDMRRVHARH